MCAPRQHQAPGALSLKWRSKEVAVALSAYGGSSPFTFTAASPVTAFTTCTALKPLPLAPTAVSSSV